MSALQVKTQIHECLEKVENEKFLRVVYAMLNTYVEEQEEVVGYNIKGEPLHIEEAKAKYAEGMAAYKRGESKSLESVKAASVAQHFQSVPRQERKIPANTGWKHRATLS